jgi:hypothetical protein
MLLGKRLFPHPVIKSMPHQDFRNSVFKLHFEQDKMISDQKINLFNLQYTTNNGLFRNMVNAGIINVYVHLECSNTLYRILIKLNNEPQDFDIEKKYLNGKLYITAFAVANQAIENYYDEDFSEDYNDTRFDIDKYDILAFDDGFSIDIIHDIEKDDKISSIFVVIPKIDDQDAGADFTYQGNKIIIKLPQLTYNQYDRLKYITRYQNLFFSIFAVPVLSMSLNELKKISFDDLEIQFKWFISVKNAFKKQYKEELTSEFFEQMDTYVFAQKVFENALTKTIDDLYNDNGNYQEEQEDEDD